MAKKVFVADFNLTVTIFNTTDDAEADGVAKRLREGLVQLLQFDGEPFQLFSAASSETTAKRTAPDAASTIACPVAHATQAQLLATLVLPSGVEQLAEFVDLSTLHATRQGQELEPWELRYVKAIVLFAHHFELDRAIEVGMEAVAIEPFDIFSLRLMYILQFLTSRMKDMVATFCGVIPAYRRRPESRVILPYLLANAGFGLEETGHGALALEWVREALLLVTILNKDAALVASYGRPFVHPYAVHAICHVYDSLNDPAAGLKEIDSIDPALWQETKLLICHIWLHLALFQYQCGNAAGAISIYDSKLLAYTVPVDLYALADGTTLLLRVALDGKLDLHSASVRVPHLMGLWGTHAAQQHSTKDICPSKARVPRLSLIAFHGVHFRSAQLLSALAAGVQQEEKAVSALGHPAAPLVPATPAAVICAAIDDDLKDAPPPDASDTPAGYTFIRRFDGAIATFLRDPTRNAGDAYEAMRGLYSLSHDGRLGIGGSNPQRDLLRQVEFFFLRQTLYVLQAATHHHDAVHNTTTSSVPALPASPGNAATYFVAEARRRLLYLRGEAAKGPLNLHHVVEVGLMEAAIRWH